MEKAKQIQNEINSIKYENENDEKMKEIFSIANQIKQNKVLNELDESAAHYNKDIYTPEIVYPLKKCNPTYTSD